MSHNFSTLLLRSHNELHIRFEVEKVMDGLVNHIDIWEREEKLKELKDEVYASKTVSKRLLKRIDELNRDRNGLALQLEEIKQKAVTVREKFVIDIGRTLRESRTVKKLQDRVKELEVELERDPAERCSQAKNQSTKDDDAPIIARPRSIHLLADLEEVPLLNVFSYLSTAEVLNTAQVNKFFFRRVDVIFGTDSKLVKEDWADRPPCFGGQEKTIKNDDPSSGLKDGSHVLQTAASVSPTQPLASGIESNGSAGGSSSAVGLTRDMADALSKKLTEPELKAIIALTEKLRKQSIQLQDVTAEREDLTARLQNAESVRDFLVEKLKTAEIAIKSSFTEISTFKKQAAADQEVISFLDLRGQELEGVNLDLSRKCSRLQAAYDLQCGSHSITERHLQAELVDLKAKLDEYETTYKAQKKLLVKEVKSLRAQLETANHERHRFKTQLQILKETLFAAGDDPGAGQAASAVASAVASATSSGSGSGHRNESGYGSGRRERGGGRVAAADGSNSISQSSTWHSGHLGNLGHSGHSGQAASYGEGMLGYTGEERVGGADASSTTAATVPRRSRPLF